MMLFPEINIKKSYRTPDNIVDEFYIPLLSNAVLYERAVGFFSSSVLIELSKGLVNLINNNGKMKLITSPRLQEDDIEAIKKGYDERSIIEKALLRDWKEPRNQYESKRLNLLANLIAEGHLDIKIAFKENGLYHEKIGILTDEDGNSVAFSGSLNESSQAMNLNFESIDAFTSWEEASRVEIKKRYFDATWNNLSEQLDVVDFPNVLKERFESYRVSDLKSAIKSIEQEEINAAANQVIENSFSINSNNEEEKNHPRLPFDKLRDYQEDAIKNWSKQNYRGIFDMATGTGKTYTGLGAVVNLYNHTNSDLAVVICCPFIHLVEQWVEDLIKFNIEPIIGYGTSSQKNWETKLKKAVEYHNYKIKNKQFFCFITTNATFNSDFVQKQISKLDNNSLLLVDEAHYFGAECVRKNLPNNFNYRLALSATIKRHNDDDGTQSIFDYFGDKCIEYTLEMAIEAGMLTPYKYHPVPVYLTEMELLEYKQLSKKIAKFMAGGDKKHIPEAAKPYLLKRARLIAGAENKIFVLKELISKYKNKNHILVYCGATTIEDPNSNEKENKKQIQVVCNMLGKELNMKARKFTAEENIKERKQIKDEFSEGSMLQVLVAIKCLDEGFNIPEIETAFILASTTNPKEYIQRRGRVLRLAKGKEFAEIYDFITLPRPEEESNNLSSFEQQYEQGLVKREFERMKNFNSLAINEVENNEKLIWKLIKSYNLYETSDVCDIL